MKKSAIFLAVFLCLPGLSAAASVGGEVRAGNKAYEEGKYETALDKYKSALKKEPESAIINFNAGTAYYKQGEYEKTIPTLQQALLSENEEVRGKAHYNLGNAFYRSGMALESQNVDLAVAALEQSLSHYQEALKIADKDEDAKYNYEWVNKELLRLKEKKQQQQRSDKKTCDNPSKDEKDKQQEQKQEEQQKEQQRSQEEKQQQDARQQQEQQQQENESGEEPQGARNQQDKPAGQQQAGDKQTDKSEQPSGQPEAGEMSRQEANMLLDDYRQNEEPQGLLNLRQRTGTAVPVKKDW